MLTKPQWRERLRHSRQEFCLNETVRIDAEQNIIDFIVEILSPFTGTVAAYKSLPSEVNLDGLEERLPHIQFAYPITRGDEVTFYKNAKKFNKGNFGILEPTDAELISVKELSAIIVPGVGFDTSGTRVGHGKGHYDRVLEGFEGSKIGVGFQVQIVQESLPPEDHDQHMSFIVCESYILKPVIKAS